MMGRVESWFDTVLRISPAQPLLLQRAKHRLTVLAYHGIDDPSNFERQLDCLQECKMNPISLTDLLDAIRQGDGLPQRPVLITFDDGHRSIFEHGLPLLKKSKIPALAFVISGLLDSTTPFWWNEVKELAQNGGCVARFRSLPPEDLVRSLKKIDDQERLQAIKELQMTASKPALPAPYLRSDELRILEQSGISIGHHSLTHPCLTRCSDAKIEEEIIKAHEILSSVLNHHPAVFAYPNGDWDQRAERILMRLGYRAAFMFDHRMNAWPLLNAFHISRVRVNSTTSLDRFRIILSGLHPVLHRMRGGV
jgi:peptidoglycan/xylan/chitin deacetylase (PgdA/CDA1 family)